MPELADSTTPETFPQKRLILFVHGFGSNPQRWEHLRTIVRDGLDQRGFTDRCFAYDSPPFVFNPQRRVSTIWEAAVRLRDELQGVYKGYEQVTLVGHSEGGLVIQRYLAGELESKHGDNLKRIWVAIFIATPNLGSLFLHSIRRILFSLFSNPQELSLRPLNQETARLVRFINKKVVRAKNRASDECPVRIQCFGGTSDNIVHPDSAQGIFDHYSALRGDHSSILEPANPDDERCTLLLNALDDPPGHTNFWEIERYETTLEVEPRDIDSPCNAEYGKHRREVRADNFARITKKVNFSPKNICLDSFVLDYMTHNIDGLVKGNFQFSPGEPRDRNERSVKEEARYNETGRDFTFRFTPRPNTVYELRAEIYGGFNQGNRSVDFDLGDRLFCRNYYFKLDLSRYRSAGWTIKEPELAIHMDDRKKAPGKTIPHSEGSVDQGVYTWKIADIHNKGVKVSVKWDVAGP